MRLWLAAAVADAGGVSAAGAAGAMWPGSGGERAHLLCLVAAHLRSWREGGERGGGRREAGGGGERGRVVVSQDACGGERGVGGGEIGGGDLFTNPPPLPFSHV